MYFYMYFRIKRWSRTCLLLVVMPHSLRAVMDTQLLIQVCYVALQCPLCDHQFLRHFLVRESHRKELKDFTLPARQGRALSLSPTAREIQYPIKSALPGLVNQLQESRARFEERTDDPFRLRGFDGSLISKRRIPGSQVLGAGSRTASWFTTSVFPRTSMYWL